MDSCRSRNEHISSRGRGNVGDDLVQILDFWVQLVECSELLGWAQSIIVHSSLLFRGLLEHQGPSLGSLAFVKIWCRSGLLIAGYNILLRWSPLLEWTPFLLLFGFYKTLFQTTLLFRLDALFDNWLWFVDYDDNLLQAILFHSGLYLCLGFFFFLRDRLHHSSLSQSGLNPEGCNLNSSFQSSKEFVRLDAHIRRGLKVDRLYLLV